MMIPESLRDYKSNRTLIDEMDSAETEIGKLRLKIKVNQGKLKYKCPECKKFSTLRDTDAIQKNYYVEPHGCTGGDYWTRNGIMWNCPKCNQKQSLKYEELTSWQSMSPHFKSITDEK